MCHIFVGCVLIIYQNPISPSKKVIARREKQRLRELKRKKKEELEKFYNDQNAQIDADMVIVFIAVILFYKDIGIFIKKLIMVKVILQNSKRKGRLKFLLQQTEIFAHFAQGAQGGSGSKVAKGR